MSAHESSAGSNSPANHFGGSFGPNEWLVDEMYQRFLEDPTSVDAAWHEFFSDYATSTSNGISATIQSKINSLPPLGGAPRGGTPPLPKAAASSPQASNIFSQASQASQPPQEVVAQTQTCLLYTSPSPRD